MDLQVRKNNGQMQMFDRNKVYQGLLKSGAAPEQAEQITAQVESWAPGAAQDKIIQSSDIRAKVLELLKSVNPDAASSYESYKKPESAPDSEVQTPVVPAAPEESEQSEQSEQGAQPVPAPEEPMK